MLKRSQLTADCLSRAADLGSHVLIGKYFLKLVSSDYPEKCDVHASKGGQ